jgi:hypothetical protein
MILTFVLAASFPFQLRKIGIERNVLLHCKSIILVLNFVISFDHIFPLSLLYTWIDSFRLGDRVLKIKVYGIVMHMILLTQPCYLCLAVHSIMEYYKFIILIGSSTIDIIHGKEKYKTKLQITHYLWILVYLN